MPPCRLPRVPRLLPGTAGAWLWLALALQAIPAGHAAALPATGATTTSFALSDPAKPPPEFRADKVRVFLSPLTTLELDADLERSGEADIGENLDGIGVSLGVDVILRRHFAFWASVGAGTVTGVEARSADERIRLSRATGSWYTISAGGAGVIAQGPFTGMAGVGLAYAEAEFSGTAQPLNVPVNSDLSFAGAVFTLRGDYTLRNGFFAGLGLDYGLGRIDGAETEGAERATGTLLLVYVPLGWTY